MGYCVPTKEDSLEAYNMIKEELDKQSGMGQYIVQLKASWEAIAIMSFVTILISLLYIWLLKWITKPLLYVSMLIILLCFLVMAAYGYMVAQVTRKTVMIGKWQWLVQSSAESLQFSTLFAFAAAGKIFRSELLSWSAHLSSLLQIQELSWFLLLHISSLSQYLLCGHSLLSIFTLLVMLRSSRINSCQILSRRKKLNTFSGSTSSDSSGSWPSLCHVFSSLLLHAPVCGTTLDKEKKCLTHLMVLAFAKPSDGPPGTIADR